MPSENAEISTELIEKNYIGLANILRRKTSFFTFPY